jgi:Zn-dependent M28 family amino/carboxypeptidase
VPAEVQQTSLSGLKMGILIASYSNHQKDGKVGNLEIKYGENVI